ncbi:MAG: hydroxymethylbilane synthase [Deltaproteobacteria bacterium]|nr:hydroxymethylbilane synthase [Deltaproteobacteria bacterium]
MSKPLVIGTRGSALALWQANHVKARLEAADPGLSVELRVIKTKGDKILDAPLSQVGGKGLFVKEIEEALLAGQVDLAVHSMKDVPAELMPGLILAAVSQREDPRDVLVSRHAGGLDGLPPGGHVGTSSLRRICQLKARRPDLRIAPLRGNVDTRLRRLDAGDFDAVVLAAAGLVRLGHAARITEHLSADVSLPAVGQGALGLETREGDAATRDRVVGVLHDVSTADCVAAERAFLGRLNGGCQAPIGAHATLADGAISLDGLVGEVDGASILRAHVGGPRNRALSLGQELAEMLLARGAAEIIDRCRAQFVVGGA